MNNEIENKIEKASIANNDLFKAINRQFDDIEQNLEDISTKLKEITNKLNIE